MEGAERAEAIVGRARRLHALLARDAHAHVRLLIRVRLGLGVGLRVGLALPVPLTLTWIMATSLPPSPMARVILLRSLTSLTTAAFCAGVTRQQMTQCAWEM